MDLQKRPIQLKDFILEQEGGETIVFHPSSARSFFLNETATIIWVLCNGENRVVDIIDQLSELYPDQNANIKQDVMKSLELFLSKEVITLS